MSLAGLWTTLRRDGYALVPDVGDDAACALLRAHAALCRQHRCPAVSNGQWNSSHTARAEADVRRVLLDKQVASIAASALRADRVWLLEDTFLGCLEPLPELGEAEVVSVPCRMGDALVHLGSTLHGSGPNRTRSPRRALSASYVGPATRWAPPAVPWSHPCRAEWEQRRRAQRTVFLRGAPSTGRRWR